MGCFRLRCVESIRFEGQGCPHSGIMSSPHHSVKVRSRVQRTLNTLDGRPGRS
jgi:hypothetical protein